jgi:hypothetical protein
MLHLVPITFRSLAFSLLGCFIFYDICFFTSLGFANRDIGEASRLLDQLGCFIFYDICFFTSLGFANRDIGEASRLLDQI